MKTKYKVYEHICPNGKIYIGITSRSLKKRWDNGNGYRSNRYFYRAIQKYDWNNIKHILLFENLTKEEAEQKEIELISKYKSNNQNYGYNIANGGNCVGMHSEETKRKISEKGKGRKAWNKGLKLKPLSEKHKEKIRQSELGKKRKPLSEEQKDYLRKIRIGTHISDEHRRAISKPISQYDKSGNFIKKWNSIMEAQRSLKITHINRVLNGERKTCGGYIWKYSEEK